MSRRRLSSRPVCVAIKPHESADPMVLEIFSEKCMTHLWMSARPLFSATLMLAQCNHEWNGSGICNGAWRGPAKGAPFLLKSDSLVRLNIQFINNRIEINPYHTFKTISWHFRERVNITGTPHPLHPREKEIAIRVYLNSCLPTLNMGLPSLQVIPLQGPSSRM